MNKSIYTLCAIGWVGLLLAASLSGCSSETGISGGEVEKIASVSISLSTEDIGVKTKTAGTATITPDDQIKTLDVYILNASGTVEAHLDESDFTFNAELNDGKANPIELTEGAKRIYAFANCDKLTDFAPGTWTNISSLIEGNHAFDALASVSADNEIPMSADTAWNISGPATHRINLIRMVAQMQITIHDLREFQSNKPTGLTIAGLQKQTHLFRKGYGEVAVPSENDTDNWSWTINNSENNTSFYLHETEGGHEISLQIENEAGARKSSLSSRPIPRNHILPVHIYLSDYSLAIEGTYQYAPIGVLPIVQNFTPEGYVIKVPEGSSNIQVKVQLKKNGTTLDAGSIVWSSSETSGTTTGKEFSFTISSLPAIAGGSKTVQLNAKYDDKTLEFVLAFETEPLTKASSDSDEPEPIVIEL